MLVDHDIHEQGFSDDESLISRILAHVEGGTTDLARAVWREPVEHYLSPDRFRRELDAVLRRLPVPFCPSAAVGESGSYVAREPAGVPIVVIRDHGGAVRAFRNACRHRGAVLVDGHGCERSLVCPYHGWTYRLDGGLRHVPGEHGFPGLDRDKRGLVGVWAVEHGGIVFVDQSRPPQDEPDTAGLPRLVGADLELFERSETTLDVNWKVFVEGFLEGYHIKATHRETFFPLGYDNLNVVETWGRHSRVTFPFRRIESLAGRQPGERRIGGMAALVHHVFPNVMVVQLAHHTTMAVVEPLAVDRSALITYELASHPARSGGPTAEARRDADFVSQGAAEDRAVAGAVQRGFASGANQVVEFGRFEGAISHFHRQLAGLLEG